MTIRSKKYVLGLPKGSYGDVQEERRHKHERVFLSACNCLVHVIGTSRGASSHDTIHLLPFASSHQDACLVACAMLSLIQDEGRFARRRHLSFVTLVAAVESSYATVKDQNDQAISPRYVFAVFGSSTVLELCQYNLVFSRAHA